MFALAFVSLRLHDNVIKWKYFACALLALCVGNQPVTGGFPSQRPVTRSFDVFFDLCPNNREAGDLRRHRAHYDVMCLPMECWGTQVTCGSREQHVLCLCAHVLHIRGYGVLAKPTSTAQTKLFNTGTRFYSREVNGCTHSMWAWTRPCESVTGLIIRPTDTKRLNLIVGNL